ncbi:sigma-70 family RNA polymerase sigma factor [Streptacidiphilus fuscans]|uniref:Sigma-70 family RNA polymerase sigma factor n=1 Tax=Streptacidiphilus fuscans TaxID=2789292 RepID=A0A931B3I4_9ACTN|nr:sigma-70 family RNA polymerase sigma factor [Streptacidiphilus fuscans]MBF9069684.1 sigma-70 family RNA polymerase sigma factor [Streptacidiphilus fuscans]
MDDREELSRRFEAERSRLRAVAYRMLGSLAEAEDAVQEAWLRLDRATRAGQATGTDTGTSTDTDADAEEIENLAGWLTTTVGRICLNQLRSRERRREDALDAAVVEPTLGREAAAEQHPADPEQEALLADEVGLAMLVVLDTLTPAERFAFVLHDMFAVPFDDIGPMMERTSASVRQLASRARRRVRGVTVIPQPDPDRRRQVVSAYLTACRGGDFEALVTLLDPDVVIRADAAAGPTPHPISLSGARIVAKAALGSKDRAQVTEEALVNGDYALVMAPLGRLAVVLTFAFTEGPDARITEINVIGDPERLQTLEFGVLDLPEEPGD